MKFPRNKKYQALYLSDVHYLLNKKIKNHSHKELFQLLDHLSRRGVRFQNLYLVGDILESWYFNAASKLKKGQKRFNRLFDRLDVLVLDGGRKYFIVGNHDTTSFTMRLSTRIEQYLNERGWRIRERVQTRDVVAVHGHQGQYTRFSWAYHIAIVRLLHGAARLFPALFRVAEDFYNRHLNRVDPVTTQEKLAYYRRLSQVAGQGNRVLISGHTHDFLCIPELQIINTGDWVDSRTFVIEKKGSFVGLRMKGRKQFERVFRLRKVSLED